MSTDTARPTLALIAYEEASRAIAAGMDYASKSGVALSFVVLDSAGHLVAAARMDGAPFVTIEVARGWPAGEIYFAIAAPFALAAVLVVLLAQATRPQPQNASTPGVRHVH